MKKIILSLLLMSSVGFAGGFVEPYLGISGLGSFKEKVSGNPDLGDFDGVPISVGARAGFVKMGLGVGLDYAITRKIKFDNLIGDGDLSELGLIVGYSFPILAKVYAGYVFTGKLDIGATEFKGLKGIKLGAGLKAMPFLSVNLEMKSYDLDEYQSLNSDSSIRMWTLSVSAPLNIF